MQLELIQIYIPVGAEDRWEAYLKEVGERARKKLPAEQILPAEAFLEYVEDAPNTLVCVGFANVIVTPVYVADPKLRTEEWDRISRGHLYLAGILDDLLLESRVPGQGGRWVRVQVREGNEYTDGWVMDAGATPVASEG